MTLKCVSCGNLTLITRLIAFIGLVIALLLIFVLLNDEFGENFDNSRLVALALGLDWRHFHSAANATHEADPEGKVISAVVIAYSFAYIVTNSFLLYGTITRTRWCTIPWLVFEFLGTASKMGALIYHSISDNNVLSKTFLTGSIIYIAIIWWCLLIVYTAQKAWKHQKIQLNGEDVEAQSLTVITTPPPYIPNQAYDVI